MDERNSGHCKEECHESLYLVRGVASFGVETVDVMVRGEERDVAEIFRFPVFAAIFLDKLVVCAYACFLEKCVFPN